jgi:hypothetical protein
VLLVQVKQQVQVMQQVQAMQMLMGLETQRVKLQVMLQVRLLVLLE